MLLGNVAIGVRPGERVHQARPVPVQAPHLELRLAPRQLARGDGAVGLPLLLGAPLDARGAAVLGAPRHATTRASATTCRRRCASRGRRSWWSWVFAPMPLLGYPRPPLAKAGQLNLLYQYWIHTEAIDRLHPLAREGAQHAVAPPRPPRRQPAVPRQELRRDPDRVGQAVRHVRARGAADQVRPHQEHPTRSTRSSVGYHEFVDIARDVRRSRSVRQALRHVFGPPGWEPRSEHRSPARGLKDDDGRVQ